MKKPNPAPSARALSGSLRSMLLALTAVSTLPAAAADMPAPDTPAAAATPSPSATPTDDDAAATGDKAQPSSPCAPRKKKRKSPCAIGG